MTTNDRFELVVTDWLRDDAAGRVPDHLAEVLEVSATTRQRAAWSSPERWLPVDTAFRPRLFQTPRLSQVLLVGAVILALLGALLLYAGSRQQHLPPPFGLARTGEFMAWEHGDIVARAPDASGPRTIVGGPTTDFAPLIARDGTKFAFFRAESDHDSLVMLANIDGSGIRQVLPTALFDADWWEWSARDDRLAIVNTVHGHRTLTIVDTAAGTSKDLAMAGLNVDNDVYWLPPAGDRLIFTARPEGTGDLPVAIYTVRPDGSDLQRISPVESGGWYNGIDVAPDGRTVSYWNYEPDESSDGLGSHIHYLDLATRTDSRIVFDPTAEGETDLRFSPDGVNVVLQRESTSTAQLLITARDGTGTGRSVGPSFSVDVEPGYGFAPDGKSVFLLFSNSKPWFFDVASGTASRGADTIEDFAGYQRLAP